MPMNFESPDLIKKIVEEITGLENKARRDESLKQFEVFMDRMEPFVEQYLEAFYNENDIKSLPLVSSINLARRIVKQEASIYKVAPKRTFENVTPAQEEVLREVYKDMQIDQMLQKSNEYFKLQAQNNIQIIPFDKKLKLRIFLNHQFDVVPEMMAPEIADAYILSGFDKSYLLPATSTNSNSVNEMIADPDDYKGNLTYVLWSDIYNFLISENGNVIGGYTPNPIGIKPFVDISPAKDFEFFVREGQSVTDFTIQFNASLTDMSQIVRLQGFAQAYLIAPESTMPTSMKIGPAICVRLPMKDETPSMRPEFGFAQPNADLEGSMKFLESLVALFLTSRGLDPKTISASGEGTTYSSGMERLLSMIEKFEATRSDFNVYQNAEKSIFKIVKAYLNTYAGSDVLKYKIAALSDDADISVQFHMPEMIETQAEKITNLVAKMEAGLMTKVEAIMEDRGIEKEEAEVIRDEIDKETQMNMPEEPVDAIDAEDDVING